MSLIGDVFFGCLGVDILAICAIMKFGATISSDVCGEQRSDAAPELIEARHKALLAGLLTISYGQSLGEVVAGEPKRLAITVFAAVEGLVSLSSDGKINGIPIEKHAEHCINDMMLGLTPR